MPRATVNGVELYFETTGQGVAVVFAHGAGGNHLSWWQQVPEFSPTYTCITYDCRGFGASSNPPDGPGSEVYSNDLLALLDHLGVERAFLIGQSMGGLTCLRFALEHPHRSLGLVLADTTGGVGERSVVEVMERRQLPENVLGIALDPSFPTQEPAKTYLYQEIFRLNPPRAIDYTDFMDGTGPKAGDLSRLRVPTLLIVGDHDVSMPPAAIELVHRMIPGSRMEVVAGAGHSVHFEKPVEFNRLVRDYFSRVLANAAER